MQIRTTLRSGLSAVVLSATLGAGWSQASVPLAEQRTILVNGQAKLITSKLSKLNPNTSRVRGVVDICFTYNFHHRDIKPVNGIMLDRFAAQEGWTVTHYYYQDPNHPGVDDRSKITLAELSKNLVIFANNISNWGNQGSSSVNTAVENYMEQTGGGLVLMHGSGDSQNSTWTFYRDKLNPINFLGHGNILPGTILRPLDAAVHPIMEGGILAEEKVVNGQWYHLENSITTRNPRAEVLMKVDPARCTNCGLIGPRAFQGGNPIAWVMPVDRSWVGFFAEGHDPYFRDQLTAEVWDRFFKQMLFYVAGYDTTSVVSALPGYERNHSGISFDGASMAVFIEKPDYHKVGLYDVGGRKYGEHSGRGVAGYDFEDTRKRLKTGMYILRVDYGRTGTATKRYVVRN